MKPSLDSARACLADVNVLLALLVTHHEHHKVAFKWFDRLGAGEAGLCRWVQLALVRLLGNRHIMGEYATSALEAWALTEELQQDERVYFLAEPAAAHTIFPSLLHYSVPTVKLVGDAWLAAQAVAARTRLVTLDSGFRQFKGLDVTVLK
jgi:toxin-antitoxin system PIN domain toxin